MVKLNIRHDVSFFYEELYDTIITINNLKFKKNYIKYNSSLSVKTNNNLTL